MMFTNIECPYCEKIVKIEKEDINGITDGELVLSKCPECLKTFSSTLRISFELEDSTKADCQNEDENGKDGEHEWSDIRSSCDIYSVNRSCLNCGFEEKIVDDQKRETWLKSLEQRRMVKK